jgi:HTH-type transcriptional regulator, glycine betaine synthesis regulator
MAEPDRLTQRVLKVCDASGDLLDYWGFKSIHGRIWTLLALRREPLPQTEIAITLGVSRSLVSTAVSELVGFGVVRSVGTHRNAPYEAVLDVWTAVTSVLREREWMLLEAGRVSLEGLIDEAQHSGSGRYDLERMRLLLAMFESIQNLLRGILALRMPLQGPTLTKWVGVANGLIDRLRKFRG